MQIAFLERLPLIAVEPDTFAAVAMIQSKVQTTADQVLKHAETTFRTIYRQARFGQRQALSAVQSL